MIVSQGDDIRLNFLDDPQKIPSRITQPNLVGDTQGLDPLPALFLVVVGVASLDLLHILVAGDHHEKFIPQPGSLLQKRDVPGMQIVEGTAT